MQSIELTKPVTTESLLSEFESRFNQTMDLTKFTAEELEDVANKIRTKIHNITQNEHFGHELKNHDYQKNQAMLDVVNQKIKEYGMGSEIKKDPETQKTVDKISKLPGLKDKDKKEIIGSVVTKEGVEEQSELILAAKDMMDKVTGYLEDLATMKTESMLELADRIRDEMGAEKADAFLNKVKPAIEQAESTLGNTRQELDNGVRVLTGEEVSADPMGADDTMNTDGDDVGLDSLDGSDDLETDEFGAVDAEAGGTEPEGREQRESKEVFEQSNRIYSKLARK
jgi:hypothetical protein